jgi:hypothetical protein
MNKMLIPTLMGAALMTGGCVAKTVWDVATLPVKAGSKAVDMATTSQAEADRNYGKKMREKEAREGRERRAWEKACKQDRSKCDRYDGYRASDD